MQTRFTLEKAKTILDELKSSWSSGGYFYGGEIFSYPHALEVIEYACDLKIFSYHSYKWDFDYRKNSRQADPAPNFRNKDFNVWHKRIS